MQLRNVLVGCCVAFLGTAGIVAAASLSKADSNFMVMAAKIDMTEAHEGQMAESHATRADVKDFAKKLVQDHTEAYDQITELAAKTGVTIPRGIDTAKDKTIAQLVRLNDSRFDKQFIRDEIADHRSAITAFKREAEHGEDADVRAYATKMIPVLESHLHQAEKCANPAARS